MDRMITPEQLAARWHTSRSYLANLRSQGKGCPYIKLGRRVTYRLEDVKAYEMSRRVVTKPVKPKTVKEAL